MSEPAALTVNTPFDAVALPGWPTTPTSVKIHGGGSRWTVGRLAANIPSFTMVGSWLVMAAPASTGPAIHCVLPIVRHVPPHSSAVTVAPLRTSFTVADIDT